MNINSIKYMILAAVIAASTPAIHRAADADDDWSPPLQDRRYLNSPLVEATPFVFKDRLYLLESWQAAWDHDGTKPGAHFQEDSARVRDLETNQIITTALTNCGFAHAFVWDGRVHVFAGDYGHDKPWRQITEIVMTSSDDLKNWTKPVVVLRAADNEWLWNTAVCRGKDGFIMLYESNDKRWPPFTFKYCKSTDLKTWQLIPDALYGTDKYVGGPALYHEGDWYYTLALEALGAGKYETRVTRSRDLKTWHDAPQGRPFVTFDPSRTGLPFRPANVHETNASDAEMCYFNNQTIIYFTGSDQLVAGDLQTAIYPGTPRELLEHFYKPTNNPSP